MVSLRALWTFFRQRAYVAWLLPLLLSGGCNLINPEEPAAAYIDLRPPLLVDGGDTLAGMVPDTWLFWGAEFFGTFVPPSRIPLLNTGEGRLLIARAGVWDGYDSEKHELYPFMMFDTLMTTPQANQTTTYQPVFRYFPDTIINVVFQEDFEGQELRFQRFGLGLDTARLVRTSESPLQGNYCGVVRFDSLTRSFDVASTETFSLPRGTSEVWAEVKFRGNIRFAVGLVELFPGQGEQGRSAAILENGYQDDGIWRAAYFRLTPQAAAALPGTLFRLRLLSFANGSERSLFLDNIRIVHFR